MKLTSFGYVLMLMLLSLFLLFFLGDSWSLELTLLEYMLINMNIGVMLDKSSYMFMSTVLMIFFMVYLYSISYLGSEVYLKRFMFILTLFVLFMFILVISGNLFTSLIGWDGLGISSFFLILFYSSNSSMEAGTLTFLMNRLGDCFFVMMMISLIMIMENPMMFSISSYPMILGVLLLLTSTTKSAQIPFSTWLPAAMEAPTPVSALVHSSTLVTAGIFMLYRYSPLWECENSLKTYLMVMSLSTCMMASLAALLESDLKKLIALSTLSQLGFILFSFSLGNLTQGFMHMVVHAFFKALLFLTAGYIIHSFNGNQNITLMMSNKTQNPVIITIMSISILSMMGLPFMSGFYSKDLIIDSLGESWSVVTKISMILTFILTSMYSVRMIWYLMNSYNPYHSMSDDELLMIKPMLPLMILSSVSGSAITWEATDMVFASMDNSKVNLLLMILLSTILYWYMKKNNTILEFLESKWYLSSFNVMISNVTFLSLEYYNKSSDLLGMPGFMNKGVNKLFTLWSYPMNKSMKLMNLGNWELPSFLIVLTLFLL